MAESRSRAHDGRGGGSCRPGFDARARRSRIARARPRLHADRAARDDRDHRDARGDRGAGAVRQRRRGAQERRASQIQILALALDAYRLDNDAFPTTEQGLEALRTLPVAAIRRRTGKARICANSCRSIRGGAPTCTSSPGVANPNAYDLYSLGKDGKPAATARTPTSRPGTGPCANRPHHGTVFAFHAANRGRRSSTTASSTPNRAHAREHRCVARAVRVWRSKSRGSCGASVASRFRRPTSRSDFACSPISSSRVCR